MSRPAPDPQQPLRPSTITRLSQALYAPMALKAAMELGLFTALAGEALSAEALARSVGANPKRMGLLCYALVAAGLLSEKDGRFDNTPEAACFLVHGLPGYLGEAHLLYDTLWRGLLGTAESLTSGAPSAKKDFASSTSQADERFFRGMWPGALSCGRKLAAKVAGASTVVDVGGGSGGLAVALCRAHPELAATVAELPAVASFTRKLVDETEVASRVGVVAIDLLSENLAGAYDAAVVRNVLQVLSAAQAEALLARVACGVRPGGRIFVWGWMLQDDRRTPELAALRNLAFLNLYEEGQAYTRREHFAWLARAGFAEASIEWLPSGHALIEAVRVLGC